MEKHENVPRRILKTFERFEPIILDSSAITEYKACNRKFWYHYVLGRVPKEDEVYFRFGTAYHKFREILSRLWLSHVSDNSSVNNISNFHNDGVVNAIVEALRLYNKLGGNPSTSGRYDFLTASRLQESCSAAWDAFVSERKMGKIQIVAIEQAFNIEYANGNRKCGRFDETILYEGKPYPRDYKASAVNPDYYIQQLDPKDQAYTYTIASSKLSGETCNGIYYEQLYNDKHTKSEKKGPKIVTHIVKFTPQQLRNWESEQEFVHASINRSRELDIYPMSEGYQCQYCKYKKACRAMSENMMGAELNSNFKFKLWDPFSPDTGE
jgi:hypothetical protein